MPADDHELTSVAFDPQPQPELLDAHDETIRRELAQVLNRNSIDTAIGVPDYIIADHLVATIRALGDTIGADQRRRT